MEDEKIIDLYWERKDEAIMETQAAYGRQLQTIAQRYNMSESKVKTRLHRIREKLRVYLMQEGIAV